MKNGKPILHINTQIIQENYNLLCNMCTTSKVASSIKANAYGLGANKIAPILEKVGCKDFFTASCDEAVILRKILKPEANIYVIRGVFYNELQTFLEHNLVPVLNHMGQIELWQKYALECNKKLPCIVHIDTGMNRLAIPYSEIKKLDTSIHMNYLNILYVMSHLSAAEDINSSSNVKQLQKFKEYSAKFINVRRSFANSSGIYLGKEYHFDLTRPGAALYGINPTPYIEDSGIKNPVKLVAPIIQLNHLPIGESVGYNSIYTNVMDKPCLVATIPVGYADGFARSLSNRGVFYINGFKAPIIGRVSMDLITIDVSEVPEQEIFLGAEVELVGINSTTDKLAQASKTNAYEIITMFGDRYEKIYS